MSYPPRDPERDALVAQITKKLNDEGRLIEAGWESMRLMVLPPTAPEVQVTEMRKAFFAGAQHLFGSIMTLMGDEEGNEPTPEDLRRVELIHTELEGFYDELKRQVAENRYLRITHERKGERA